MSVCAALEPASQENRTRNLNGCFCLQARRHERQVFKDVAVSNGHVAVGDQGPLSCLENYETGLPGNVHWWPSGNAALLSILSRRPSGAKLVFVSQLRVRWRFQSLPHFQLGGSPFRQQKKMNNALHAPT
jgi:hypothetical protein